MTDPLRTPQQTPLGWSWSVPGAAGIEATREAAEKIAEAPFQSRVQPWMTACFGPEISGDRLERSDRLLEEVLELLQSGDYPRERIAALTGYVWSRPKGEPVQEVGGVMVTLAAYCLAHGLDMHEAGETELARIWNKVEKIRAKQAAKPTGSALPQAWPEADLADAQAQRIHELDAVVKGVTALIPMDYLRANDTVGATGPTPHLDLVSAMRAFAEARWKLIKEVREARATEEAQAHDGWLYHCPDSGLEWSEDHPHESGQCTDATDVRPATVENLKAHLLNSWEAWAEDRERADAQAQENARLREALDPNHTKADYIGEFRERVCFGTDEEGNEIWQYVPISWNVIKQIMAAIRARAALGDAT